jgi:hypothetical protein
MPEPSPPARIGTAAPERDTTLLERSSIEDIHAAFAWTFAEAAQKLASKRAGAGVATRPHHRVLFVRRVDILLARMLIVMNFFLNWL